MNLKINKVLKYLVASILTTSIISCNRYIEPVKVDIDKVTGTNLSDTEYTIISNTTTTINISTSTTSTSTSTISTNISTTDMESSITYTIDDEDNSNSIDIEYPRMPELSEPIKTTAYATTTTISETTTTIETKASSISFTKEYIKTFSRGTYYCYGRQCYGGSGRSLIDCSVGDGTVKGSVASSYLYNNYGYNYNGQRTMIYLEINGYPDMNGYYYLDDCDAGNSNVIDFFYIYGSNCPFCNQGVVTVDCYMIIQD